MNKYLIIVFSFLLFIYCEKQEITSNNIDNDWTTKTFSFNHDGLVRNYILHKPENFIENSPLLFVLH